MSPSEVDEKELHRSEVGVWYSEATKGDRIGDSWLGLGEGGRSEGCEAGVDSAHCWSSTVGSLTMESMWQNETVVGLASVRCMAAHPSW